MPLGNPASAEHELAQDDVEVEVTATTAPPPSRIRWWSRRWAPDLAGGAGAVSITVLVQTIVLRLWDLSPRVPLMTRDDAYLSMVGIRNIQQTGWWTRTDKLGAPLGQDLHDYPAPGDALHFLAEKVLSWFTDDVGLIINLFWLATFPVIALSSYLAFRGVGIRRATAVAVSVLYALLPYHFLRGESHLFLSSYFAVPLVGMLAIRQMGDSPLARIESGGSLARRVLHRGNVIAVAIVLLASTTGLYYAVFGVLIIAIAGSLRAARTRRWSDTLAPAVLIGLVAVALAAQVMPTLLYRRANGDNPDAIVRSFAGIETYSLKFSNLILPLGSHRLSWLAELRLNTAESPIGGEGSETLGIVGAVGLLTLLVVGLMAVAGRSVFSERSVDTVRAASACVIGALLVATIGGLSSLIGALGFTEIRAWNRISVYIAFFSLVATAVVVDELVSRLRRATAWSCAVAALLIVVGAYDQTSDAFAPSYDAVAAEWNNDKGFVEDIAKSVGPDAMIFQLPIARFPEQGTIANMPDYRLAVGYLHSDTLHWSYGGVKGRESDWQLNLSGLPTRELLDDIAIVGYDGVYIDRRGFTDGAAQLEADLRQLVDVEPFPSQDQLLLFFDIRPYRDDLVRRLGDTATVRRQQLISPVVQFGAGFYGLERPAPDVELTWSTARSEFALHNDGESPLAVRLTFRYASIAHGAWSLDVEGAGVDEVLSMSDAESTATLDLTIPPGTSALELSTDAPPDATTDPRDLHFRVVDLEVASAR